MKALALLAGIHAMAAAMNHEIPLGYAMRTLQPVFPHPRPGHSGVLAAKRAARKARNRR